MTQIPTFGEYLASLGRLTAHVDPTAASPHAAQIKDAADSLATLPRVDEAVLTSWVHAHPGWVHVLGLAVGLSQEKLRNTLKHHFGTAGWVSLARARPADLVAMLDRDFDLLRLLAVQRRRGYDFGDTLAARAGTRGPRPEPGSPGEGSRTRLRPLPETSACPVRPGPDLLAGTGGMRRAILPSRPRRTR